MHESIIVLYYKQNGYKLSYPYDHDKMLYNAIKTARKVFKFCTITTSYTKIFQLKCTKINWLEHTNDNCRFKTFLESF